VEKPRSSLEAVEARAAALDRVVCDSFARSLAPAAPAGVALLAVGGYGRGQLFPYSDVDLLLLAESERLAADLKEPISTFLRELWDARLRVSHSVRTPQECCELHNRNLELNVSLLDQRLLAGDLELYGKLTARLPRFVHRNKDAFVRRLSRLTRERHAKYQNTIYHMEPNVKESPGGLRDYQLLRWLEQIRGAGAEGGESLDAARDFLFDARFRLHQMAGRDANVLTFEAQDSVAEAQGRAPAALMRDYYRHARAVSRLALRALEAHEAEASSLFAQFREWRSRLGNAEVAVVRGRA
jgi:[protein-PII] uridylyltransferase